MRFLVLFFLLCLGYCACSTKNDLEDRGLEEVIAATSAQIEKNYNAEISAVGLAAAHGVDSMTLNFSIEKNVTIERAREIIVESAECFLNNINTNTNLRLYLVEYPFSPSRISMTFWITDGTYDPIRIPGDLKSFSLDDGVIEYSTVSKKGRVEIGDKDVVMHKETFEEAKRILKNETHF